MNHGRMSVARNLHLNISPQTHHKWRRIMSSCGNIFMPYLAALLFGFVITTTPAQAADCAAESGITARDLAFVQMKPDGKPRIDTGALFFNAATGNKALAALHRCAANNDAEAMAFLGMYYSGKDDAKAVEWYKRAYAGGSNVGCNIAKKYDFGEGVQRNTAEAAKWYLKSADRGDAGCRFQPGSDVS